jgi:intracellular multiplication protein IcmO
MALDSRKFEHKHAALLRDIRPLWMRISDSISDQNTSTLIFVTLSLSFIFSDQFFNGWPIILGDIIVVLALLYFWWLTAYPKEIAFKLPMGAPYKDNNNVGPGRDGTPEGILYLGNMEKTNEEVWFTNADARTHILYLGTTGSGKTVGLTSMVSNALSWGSGFVYVDGKADTDLWSKLSSLCRRFGRDDDLLVLNYMTGNSDAQAPSNTMNPFSSGSASYLVNMLVELMPESEGDNAMWKERAVSLVSAMMPVLTFKRDTQDVPLSVRSIRDHLSLAAVIKLARDSTVPEELRAGTQGYLDTLPGYNGDAFDDNGQPKPPEGGGPPPDTTTANQQHGYLAMQFTRSLQSLGDDYGYIFDTQAADVDMVDIVLNRRVLIVLIPALEKSGDEIANLGKIVAATIKGMMGSALGSTVEGEASTVIENKPTHSSTPFMVVFDEVGYYTAQGMAVMAAQARSLGFCLVFSGQDLPAMKKRVREEANSITANCNIKLFGKLEDPTETKEFFEKTVGSAYVTEVSSYQMSGSGSLGSYQDTHQAAVQTRARASYEALRGFNEGQAIVTFGEAVIDAQIFYSNPGNAKAMRVTKFMALPPPSDTIIKHAATITALRDNIVNKTWTAARADVAVETPPEIKAMADGFKLGEKSGNRIDTGIGALIAIHAMNTPLEPKVMVKTETPASPPKAAPMAEAEAPTVKSAAEKPLPDSLASPLKNLVTPDPVSKAEETKAAPTIKAAPSDSSNPMGFFSGEPGEKKTETPAPAASEPAQAAPQTQAQAQPAAQKPKALPPEIEKILKSAGQDSRDALFKNKTQDTKD